MQASDPTMTLQGPRRHSSVTIVILALLLVAVGFLAGAFTGHHFGQPVSAVTIRGRFLPRAGQSFGPGFPGAPGTAFPGSANVSLAAGTIKSVSGNTITLQTRSGGIVSVQVGSATAIRVTTSGSLKDLTPGSTIVVAGTRTGSGAMQARVISQGGAFAGRFGAGSSGLGSSGSGSAAPSS